MKKIIFKKAVVLSFFTLQYSVYAFAQNELPIPQNMQDAFDNKTRSMDGKSGISYWENHADYKIDVTVTPPSKLISGKEEITYYNNSPNELNELGIRIIQNVHKQEAARNATVSKGYFTDGMNITSFSLNGIKTEWNPKTTRDGNGTELMIALAQPLVSGASIKISFEWNYELSTDIADDQPRDGVIDSTTFFLAYWYPRLDVYDDVNGWKQTNFTELQEFYNDFNNYSFSIHAPEGFIVWATGEQLNADEVLSKEIYKKLKESVTSDSVIHVITENDFRKMKEKIPSGTWNFSASNVTDVAFGLSNHYLWDAGSVAVSGNINSRVSVQSAYKTSSEDFKKEVWMGKQCLSFFSTQLPGVPYPYPKMILFNGLSYMEYPMMVNDDTDPDYNDWVATTAHEIAHTYFPFYMGINESRYAWMDEGWAAFNELNFSKYNLGTIADTVFTNFYIQQINRNKQPDIQMPIFSPSTQLNGRAYENNSYGKPAIAYWALKDLLGEELFKKCLLEYMSDWNGKHPIPFDFFFTFNRVSGMDLNWFWKQWFFEPNYIDIELKRMIIKNKTATIDLKNIGGMPVPVYFLVTYFDSTTKVFHFSPEIWKAGKDTELTITTDKSISKIIIQHGIFLERNMKNEKTVQSDE